MNRCESSPCNSPLLGGKTALLLAHSATANEDIKWHGYLIFSISVTVG